MKQSLKSQLMKLKQQKTHQTTKSNQLREQEKGEKQKQQTMDKFVNKQQHKRGKQHKKNNKDIFQNLTFCFPHYDVDLTKKQADYVTKQILLYGGNVIDFSQHLNNQPIHYVLISSKARVQSVQKKLQGRVNYIDILDYNFIECCIAEGQIVDHEGFSRLNVSEEEKKQRKDSDISSGHKKRKQSESEKHISNNEQNHSLTQQLPPSDDDNNSSDPQQRNFKQQQNKLDRDKFFCQAGKKDDKPTMNKFIQQELLELQKIYANERDIGRRIAYGKAASIIKTWKEEIRTEEDVDKIPGIGPKINKKIKEIVTTGKLKKLEELNQSQEVVVMGELSKVWGIGPAKAKELYKQGIKSIQQLRKNQSSLTRNQKIGLKYFEDFQKRIPREKIQKMYEVVRKTLTHVTKTPQAYKSQVCGSYRRGKSFCGDMDIIITRKDGVFQKDLLVKLVSQLQKIGFLTDNLSQPKCSEGHVSTSYMGVCKFQDETHHRIDIKHYPLEEYAFALLYFTGSGMFNRSMRLYSSKMGLQLSDKGFEKRPYKDVVWTKSIPICYTEEDIFNVLGLDYKTPQQRDD